MNECNPLHEAVQTWERYLDAHAHVMVHVGDEECLDNFDEKLSIEVNDFIIDSYDAVALLSPRARRARLNARWRDFIASRKTLTP
jgi:hypothetical protein